MIPPGSTIGILGGGQLGRMLAIAAASMGYRVHSYAPDEEIPGGDVSAEVTRASYDDFAALDRFAASVDVVTYEFENIDVAAVEHVARIVPVRPGAAALRVSQDRVAEKEFVAALGGRPAPYRAVGSLAELAMALSEIGAPALLKTRRFGYDGKGQARIDTGADAERAWALIGERPAVLEGLVRFDAEFSVLLARGLDGDIRVYDTPRNEHASGVLSCSTLPAGDPIDAQAPEAIALAHKVADKLDYVGLLTLEFFATADGPVFNEMAPRVHNSGHWTIEGARVSQFENHIRAVCGLPLGDPSLTAPSVRLDNLLGDAVHDWQSILADPHAHLHLYGKSQVKPGRKMGHVTRL
ncbi:MAG: 5-(carboxyamino)imidazole ribonucleotide synthase [Sphingomonadaceae bacterium]|nr:5-(carboxyamino)imidazole ribonucleotide synthase [Sphingomonadaceae bacterium]